MVAQADLSVVITCLDIICLRLAWFQTVQTEVSSVVPEYGQIRLVSLAHDLTGHKTGSSVWPWMTVSCFSSFFFISNVTVFCLRTPSRLMAPEEDALH